MTIATISAALGGPAIALATLSEVGYTKAQQQQQAVLPTLPAPSCPANPCLAVSRTTGFQVKTGTDTTLFTVPHNGVIVAWSITLGNPSKKQIAFFNANEGGSASAGIAVLRSGPHLSYRLLAQSPVVPLQKYFGKTAQFPLAQTISVKKGSIVALSVPTWAPALALGFGNDTSWRASRAAGKCTDTTTQSVHATLQSVAKYTCLYRTARLTYSATLITTP